VTQRVDAPLAAVWPIVRGFTSPPRYKHFIKSCDLNAGEGATVGSFRGFTVILGLQASTSTERIEILNISTTMDTSSASASSSASTTASATTASSPSSS
jgi:hypothetical protein